MYLCFVDESGDTGMTAGGSPYFILTAIVVHERRWLSTLNLLLDFRRELRKQYGLKVGEELHAQVFLREPGALTRIPKSLRLRVLGDALTFASRLSDLAVINVVVDKRTKALDTDIFERGWTVLLQRFHNGVMARSFPGSESTDERGMVIVDTTDEVALRRLVRRVRRFNPVPSRQGGHRHLPMEHLVEDPVHRDSQQSYFIQFADVISYFLKQRLDPNGYVKKKGARNWFNRVQPILYLPASPKDPDGIVFL
jgi:hypothetical protein